MAWNYATCKATPACTPLILSSCIVEYQLFNIMDLQRTKDLIYIYKFTDFALFASEILNTHLHGMIIQKVEFTQFCMEFSATVNTQNNGSIRIILSIADRMLFIYRISKRLFWHKPELIAMETNADLYNFRLLIIKHLA